MSLFSQKNTRDKLLRNVHEASFAVDEARLYLDTHPEDEKAKRFFDISNDKRRKALQEFEQCHGALLSDNIDATKDGWTWIDNPFPWDEVN